MADEFLEIGIKGFDNLLEGGGIPKGSMVVVSGGPGSGKTSLLMQFLLQGMQEGDLGIFVSFEESVSNLCKDYKGWNNGKGIKGLVFITTSEENEQTKGQLGEKLIEMEGKDKPNMPEVVDEKIEKALGRFNKEGEKRIRVAIDSLSAMLSFSLDHDVSRGNVRNKLLALKSRLETHEATTLLSAEGMGSNNETQGGVGSWSILANFVARGVIQTGLHGYGRGELVKWLMIRKMRGTKHSTTRQAFEVTKNGIEWIGELI